MKKETLLLINTIGVIAIISAALTETTFSASLLLTAIGAVLYVFSILKLKSRI